MDRLLSVASVICSMPSLNQEEVRERVSTDRSMDSEMIVNHSVDGGPTVPGSGSELDMLVQVSGGVLEYRDSMAGPMEGMYKEPIGMVNDTRLQKLYLMAAKLASVPSSGSSDGRWSEIEKTLEAYLEARGVTVPSVSVWYATYLPREIVWELGREFPGFERFEEPSAETTSSGDELRFVRFTEYEYESVADVASQDIRECSQYPENPNPVSEELADESGWM